MDLKGTFSTIWKKTISLGGGASNHVSDFARVSKSGGGKVDENNMCDDKKQPGIVIEYQSRETFTRRLEAL